MLSNVIALTMIVKDCAKELDKCLKSAEGFYDYLSITDTGSSDNTIKVAEKYGAHLSFYHTPEGWEYPFIDHFADARNLSMDVVPTSIRWISWLDSDDILIDGYKLREKVLAIEKDPTVVMVDYLNQEFNPIRPRVWTNGSQRWAGRVHEELIPQMKVSTKRVKNCGHVYHNRSKKVVRGHQQRDIVLLKMMFEEEKTSMNAFQLACHSLTLSDWRETAPTTVDLFQFVIDNYSPQTEFLVLKSKYKLALLNYRLSRISQCLDYCNQVVRSGNLFKDAQFYKNTLKMIDKLSR